jgi:hypothetical protein
LAQCGRDETFNQWLDRGVSDQFKRKSLVTASFAPVAPSESVKLPFEAEMQFKKQMGFTAAPQASRSAEIADYIDRLGKLYSCYLTTAGNMPTLIELATPQINDVATTLFIQSVRHFEL